jgi:aspartyl-tRNA synthetase
MPDALVRHSCGSLRHADVGAAVSLSGWINRRRDHGGLIFLDLRDRDGLTQIVIDPQRAEVFAIAESLRNEDVVRIDGTVRERPAGTENAKLATGAVEVAVTALTVYSRSQTPPFVVANDDEIDENVRLRYRYLDLRRPRMQRNLTIRHKITKAMRDYFDERDFLEIETPVLIKSTPEGARDYLVPSRIHRGSFYALPQSPQLLKQILMVGGLGRYIQIARCFRDEDPRADRQPEFTQLDVELSFTTEEEVVELMEGCITYVWEKALGVTVPQPIPRLTHAEAMRIYGSDKPDLRFDLPLIDVKDAFATSEFTLFRELAANERARVIALRYPGGASLSRRDFDALTETAKLFGAKGLVWVALGADGTKSSIQRFLNDDLTAELRAAVGAETGDAILLVGDTAAEAAAVAGKLRLEVGDRCGLRDPARFAFCWVMGFPLFEADPETGAPMPAHHPFTAPAPGQEALLDVDPFAMRAQHYDLVLNGFELGSGSIRIHDAGFQQTIFRKLGYRDEQIADRFGFFMEALSFGAPPHGGMALGLDRVVMLACGETSIRDVIAFPKNQQARDVMMDAPSGVPDQYLRDLGVVFTKPNAAASVAP